MTKPPSVSLSPQALVSITALGVWALLPHPALWALVAAYGVAWLGLNYAAPKARAWRLPLPRWGFVLVLAVVLGGVSATLIRERFAVLADAGLAGAEVAIRDRLWLEARPTLSPATVHADHPQSLYAHAPEAQQVHLRLGEGIRALVGTDLGHGLFRIDYDPRTDGVVERWWSAAGSATLDAELEVDGRIHRRSLKLVAPAAHPRWLASSPSAGLAAAVSEETDEVFVVSRQGLIHRIPVDDGPTDVVFLDAGRTLAVSHRYSARLRFVDAETGETKASIEMPPFMTRLAVSPDERRLAVGIGGGQPGLAILEVPESVPTFVDLGFAPDWLVFGGDAATILVADRSGRALERLVRSDDGSWTAAQRLPLGRPAVTMVRSIDGGTAFVAVTDYQPGGEIHRGNHFVEDQILLIDTARLVVLDRWRTARRSPRQTSPGNVDRGLGPIGIAPRADGTVLVAFSGSDEVWVWRPGRDLPERMITEDVLELVAPHGVADLGDGHWAATSPAGGVIAVFDGHDALTSFLGVAPSDAELADGAEDSVDWHRLDVRAGERAFYEGTRSGISCQSCHLHADTDESPHDIGQVPLLPTLTVRGVAGTAPYLRDGSFARVRDLDTHLASGLYRGYRRDLPGRGLLVEAYVESLPRAVNPARLAPRNLDRERRGVAAFVRAGCDRCHTFPALTNLSAHPVRALFPDYGEEQPPTALLDTPSLIGSHARAHFLQDGRAHDLGEVLDEHNAANRHGDPASLDATAKADLIYWLEQL